MLSSKPKRNKRNKRTEPRLAASGGRNRAGPSSTTADRPAPAAARKPKPKTGSGSRPTKPRPRAGSARRKSGRRKGRGVARVLIGGLVYWSFIATIWGGIGIIGVLAFYGAQLPSASTWAVPDRPPNVQIIAADGSVVTNRGATGGQAVGLHEMSPYIPKAVIAIEDRRFFSHFGVDLLGLTRAMVTNVRAGGLVQGGSTLTQQLAKNLFLTPERTIGRKVQEVLLALWLERNYTKEQILEMYLNRVYFGSGSYGVEAAARRYFNRSARDVTLSQAAILAGLLKAPSRLSPNRNPQRAEARAQLVLTAMRQQGLVSDSEMTTALSQPAARVNRYWAGAHHYMADAVMDRLPALIGEIGADVVVDTTIDPYLQTLAEAAIGDQIRAERTAHNVSQGALVALDLNGAVRAMVGGTDYAASQFDRALEAHRQPGSAFKPFVYLTALQRGLTPATVRNDAPVRYGDWAPENYGGEYLGAVTLETALARSLNSVAVQLIVENGPASVVRTAQSMGISSPLKANPSLALGTSEVTLFELTSAYLPFATGGWKLQPHLIERVTTVEGQVLYERSSDRARVLAPELARMMNRMMAQSVRSGTGRAARFDHPAAGKTGTTQNERDAWFVGYTGQYVAGVWFGNDDGAPMKNVTGGTLPARAWRAFMEPAHAGLPVIDLPGSARIDFLPPRRPAVTAATGPRRPANDVGGPAAGGRQPRTVLDVILGR